MALVELVIRCAVLVLAHRQAVLGFCGTPRRLFVHVALADIAIAAHLKDVDRCMTRQSWIARFPGFL